MNITDTCEDVEQLEFSPIAGGRVSCATALENGLGQPTWVERAHTLWPNCSLRDLDMDSLDVMCGLWIVIKVYL